MFLDVLPSHPQNAMEQLAGLALAFLLISLLLWSRKHLRQYQHETFTEWARKCGDVVYARLLTKDVLIINSAAAARALMEKRGAKYSGRPPCTYLNDLSGFSWNIGFMQYDDRWRRHRRWFQNGFQVKKRLDSYVPIQQRETRRFLVDLLREPDAFMDHFKRLAAAIMLEVGYGHTVTSVGDAHVRKVDAAVGGIFEAGNPGSMLVDFFPVLKWIPAWMPGASWKRTADRLRPAIDSMNLDPFRAIMEATTAGTAKPSFATAILEEAPTDEPLLAAEEREMSGARERKRCVQFLSYKAHIQSVYGSQTVSVLSLFVFAMVRHPEVYTTAQAEMDRIVGRERLPQFDDRQELPYLECVLKEVYRAMLHDETIYEDPDDFKPERFLNIEPALAELRDPRKIVFGHGRRICPGRFLGDSSIWLVIANMIATFDLAKARDSAGRDITPTTDFVSGFVRHPKHFVCDIRPRSERSAELISRSFQEGDE
ncbi:cytochrome P450 [Fomitopsis serialis]|uniref:cytochrome P450 n=1 Tax=Fomitopsis serialis TaxID=139415 RepID=UPI002007E369|nr:cytochrome P450 [Neoantrodia serialis]KAH9917080.1 cytochrome P450 [Neoantrodia serialis]